MIDLIQRNGLLDSAAAARVQVAVTQVLPGLMVAISCGGLGASVGHLLPILFGSREA